MINLWFHFTHSIIFFEYDSSNTIHLNLGFGLLILNCLRYFCFQWIQYEDVEKWANAIRRSYDSIKIVYNVSIQQNRKWQWKSETIDIYDRKNAFSISIFKSLWNMDKVLRVHHSLMVPTFNVVYRNLHFIFPNDCHSAMDETNDGFVYHFLDTVFISRRHLKCVWREWFCFSFFFSFSSEISVRGERHSKSERVSLGQEMVVSAHMNTKRMKEKS